MKYILCDNDDIMDISYAIIFHSIIFEFIFLMKSYIMFIKCIMLVIN